MQNDLRAVLLGAVHLHQRRGGGHDHRGLHAGHPCGIGHALGVVSGGGGDEAVGLLLLRQLTGLVVSAANFISAGDLQILRLEIDLIAAKLGKIAAVHQIRLGDDALQNAAGLFELVECEHG